MTDRNYRSARDASITSSNARRVEDPRFVRGEARFLDDLQVEGPLHLRSVRAPVAHGTIRQVDVSSALNVPGVDAVYRGTDLGLKPTPPAAGVDAAASRPLIAVDRVRFVGEIVAVVLAETARAAADAASRVWADIDPLPAASTLAAALAGDAPLLYPELGSNVVKQETSATDADPADLFAGADVVVRGSFSNQRLAPVPLEANGAMAIPEPDGSLTLWVGSQNVFNHRDAAARALDVDPAVIRGRVPDMGGAFGAKSYAYPEQILAAELARRHGRPVKWVEQRSENLVAMTHGRAQHHEVEIGATADGTLVALRVHIDQDVGAYPIAGAAIPWWTRHMASGPYRIGRIEASYRAVVTNTMSIAGYRGAGRPEATAFLERSMDMLAVRLGIDPSELRRRNFFQPAEFPVRTATGAIYDSGDYEAALDRALTMAGYAGLRAEQHRRRAGRDRVQLGIGLSSYVAECAGEELDEWAAADVASDGTVTVRVGTSAHGQGHETAFAQIAGSQFKIPATDVKVIFGDSEQVPRGLGTGGSRSLQVGGGAVLRASEKVIQKARRIVARLQEASVEDVAVLADGRVGVVGVPDSALTWAEVAVAASGETQLTAAAEPGLGAETVFEQKASTYPFGTHLSVVEVDTETGDATIIRHVAVDDAGEIANAMLADGQVHGGAVQGIGQARFEEFRYDEHGNPLTSLLASYSLPMPGDVPSIEVAHTVTPTGHNPLGAKGIGESATIGATVAVQNAVVDALQPFGVGHVDMPATPERVWHALHG